MAFDPDARVQVPDHVFSREFGEELVLLDLDGGDYFALNEVGAALFRAFSKGNTLREAVHGLASAYDVGEERMMSDFVTLADDLAGRGLIRVVP